MSMEDVIKKNNLIKSTYFWASSPENVGNVVIKKSLLFLLSFLVFGKDHIKKKLP